jgi:hypothetical protein
MTLIGHAIASAPPVPVAGSGLRGRPLAWSQAGHLGLWSTEWDDAVKLDPADAMEHHGLVERICAAQPCLPVRFGTAFASDDAARASLETRAGALREALDRVAGKSELAVTLLWRAPIPAPVPDPGQQPGPGRRYMKERRARYAALEARRARAAELAGRIVAELAGERPLVWHEICTSENVAVSLAVLVPTDRALERKAEVERIASGFDDVAGVVNGPWPPYTFARIE